MLIRVENLILNPRLFPEYVRVWICSRNFEVLPGHPPRHPPAHPISMPLPRVFKKKHYFGSILKQASTAQPGAQAKQGGNNLYPPTSPSITKFPSKPTMSLPASTSKEPQAPRSKSSGEQSTRINILETCPKLTGGNTQDAPQQFTRRNHFYPPFPYSKGGNNSRGGTSDSLLLCIAKPHP